MKNNKIFLVVLLAIAMLFYSFTLMTRPDPEVFVMKPSVEVKLRHSARFVEEYGPEGSTIKVTCVVENPYIASIAEDHISVNGKNRGTTNVTCSFNGKEFGTVEVTVK